MRTGLLAAMFAGMTAFAVSAGEKDKQPAKPPMPDVTGAWQGTWGPVEKVAGKEVPPMKLDCSVVHKGDNWEATFEGECGRPYKYTITMAGRQAGEVVLFKGTTDLGPKDGGVYDWIGRATDKEFIGFYTSANYSGVFRLERPK